MCEEAAGESPQDWELWAQSQESLVGTSSTWLSWVTLAWGLIICKMGTIPARTKAVRLQEDDGKVLCKLLHVGPSSSLVPSSNFVFLLLPWSSGPQGGAGQMGSGGTRLFRKALFSCSCTLPVARNTSGTFPAGGSSPFWCTHLVRKTPHPCLREAGQSRMKQGRKSHQRKGKAHAPPSSTATEPLSAREQSGRGSRHHPPHTWQGLWCAERGTVPRGAKWHTKATVLDCDQNWGLCPSPVLFLLYSNASFP